MLVSGILLITALAFIPVLQNDFTNWDDEVYVLDNENIREFSSETISYWATAFHHGNYHPLTMLTYVWEYSVAELDPFLYHLDNLLLHLLNTFLVFIVIRKLTKNEEVAAITSIIFGIHPLHVESVAWISERKDVLYSFFYLAAISTYLNYVKSGKALHYVYTVLLFLLSLFSKSAATVLPLVLILIDYFQGRKWDKKAILEKIPLLGISFVFGLLAIESQHATDSIAEFDTFTTFQRFMFACYGALMYVFRFVWPTDLTCYHPYPHLIENGTRLPYIFPASPFILLVVLGLVAWSLKKTRIVVFGFGFYFLNVALVLQFVSVGSAIYAERYSYMAYVGLGLLVGYGVYYLKEWKPNYKHFVNGAILLVVGVLAILTHGQAKVWKNSITLWNKYSDVYWEKGKEVPNSSYGLFKIAEHYMRLKDDEKTLEQFQYIIKHFPFAKRAYMGIGNIYGKQGKYKEALAHYEKSEQIAKQRGVDPGDELFVNRAITYSILKQYDKAFSDYENAIKRNPKNYKIRINRAYAFLDNGNYQEAINDYNYVLQFEPQNQNLYFLRGIAFQNQKNWDAAIKDYSTSIQLNPKNPNAYHNRAICFEQTKAYKQAYQDILTAEKLGKKESKAYVEKLRNLAN